MNSKIMKAALLLCMATALHSFLSATPVLRQTPNTRVKEIEPDVHAPNLYSDSLKLKMTLINLPGAAEAGSSWEVSYQVFFVPEAKVREMLKGRPSGGWNPTPADFPGRILLGEGKLRRTSLRALSDRTYLSADIPLKARVRDKDRTKFATILTSYSVKIFDAGLKSSIYRSGTFVTRPFADDPGGGATARTLLYANFYVSPQGRLFYSQWPRNSESTTWP
jgi:hypothetical protein